MAALKFYLARLFGQYVGNPGIVDAYEWRGQICVTKVFDRSSGRGELDLPGVPHVVVAGLEPQAPLTDPPGRAVAVAWDSVAAATAVVAPKFPEPATVELLTYGGIIEMTRTMVDLANRQAESAKALQSDAEARVKSLSSNLKDAEKDLVNLKREDASCKLLEMSKILVIATEQLSRSGQANNAVTDLLSRIPTTITTFPPTVVQRPSSLEAIVQSGGNWPPTPIRTPADKAVRPKSRRKSQ